MNRSSSRARTIVIARTSDERIRAVFRLGVIATGAMAALLALLA